MAVDLGVFARQKSLVDQLQLQDAFEAKKALLNATIGAKAKGQALPAALQLANQYQERMAAGDVEGANLIMQFAKTNDKGLQVNADGTYGVMAGYAPAVANIAATKTGAEEQAKLQQKLEYEPQIAQDVGEVEVNLADDKAAATAMGKEVGGSQGVLAKKAIQAPSMLDLINQARTVLPSATSGRIQNIGTNLAGMAGITTDAGESDAQLDVIAAGLTSNVPRMEGPQSDADAKLYRQAAANVSDRNQPTGVRLAALDELERVTKKYANNDAVISTSETITPTTDFSGFKYIGKVK